MLKLAIGWLTLFVMGTDLFVISPLLPGVAGDFAISPARAGLSVTVFSITYMASAPLFGRLADHFGRKRLLIWCLLAFAAANVLTAAAGTFAALLAARIFAGAMAAGVSPAVYALVGEAAPPARRATWMGIAVSGLLLALSLGTPLGGLAGAVFGWAVVFAGLAAASMLLALANQLAWPGGPPAAPVAAPHRPGLTKAVLLRRLAPTVVWATALYSMYTYLGAGLTELGYSPEQIARVLVFYGCGAIAGTLLGGRLADRRGARFTMGVSLIGLAACFTVLQSMLTAGLAIDLVLAAASMSAQLFFPAQQAGLANDFPAERATVLAWNNSGLFLGIFLGSLVGGEAMVRGGLAAILVIGAAIALAGFVVTWAAASRRPVVDGADPRA
ncbi:MAG TPA: MFS transporter [Alphaproteobacteria bacterium]